MTSKRYLVILDHILDVVVEANNELDAKIKALNKLNIEWEPAPLHKLEVKLLDD